MDVTSGKVLSDLSLPLVSWVSSLCYRSIQLQVTLRYGTSTTSSQIHSLSHYHCPDPIRQVFDVVRPQLRV